MCGIIGYSGGDKIHEFLMDGLSKIAHRGPDNIGYEIIDNSFLGHARLSIIDLSENSNQPMWDKDRNACIIFNGEIYNYKEIRSELVESGVSFHTDGDAEVILQLYLHGAEDWINKLNGIFSFAIYDVRNNDFFIARDPFGVKPLYYFQNESGFFFSSEIKALQGLPCFSQALNYNAILRTIVFLWSPGPETVYKDVYKLEPGNYLRVNGGRLIEKRNFWSWPKYSPVPITEEEASAAVIVALRESVRQQLVADVPIGSFLSGGLDSSLIVALAKNVGAEKIQCFTIDSMSGENNDGFVDDLPYAQQVAKFLDVDLNVVHARPDIVRMLPKMIYYLDEPQADPAAINVMMISSLAKSKDIKVLLSGAGGDDIFTGYRRHRALSLEKYWCWLPVFVRGLIQFGARCLPQGNPFWRRLSKAFYYAKFRENERILSYFYWIDPRIVRDLFLDDIANQLDDDPMKKIIGEIDSDEIGNSIEKMLFLERKYFLVDHNFNYTDKMSMSSGVEVRVPFLDKKLIDIASMIPSGYKQKGKEGKWVLKKAAESYLPRSIIYRSKSGFGAPLRTWLNNDLRKLVDNLLSRENVENRGIFKWKSVHDLIEQDRLGKSDNSYPIFALLCIEVWMRIFIDGDMSEFVDK